MRWLTLEQNGSLFFYGFLPNSFFPYSVLYYPFRSLPPSELTGIYPHSNAKAKNKSAHFRVHREDRYRYTVLAEFWSEREKASSRLSCIVQFGVLLSRARIYRTGGWVNTDIYNRGLQCFKLNGNHTEKDRYWQKNGFLLFAKCLKMCSFFRICI